MKKVLTLIIFIVLVFSLTACQAANTDTSGETQTESELYVGDGWSSMYYTEDMAGTTLNLYGVTDKVRPILDEFEADTGIIVEHLTLQNGEILQRLENEYDSGVVIADLWFTGGADTFITAANEGLLVQYESPVGQDLDDNMKDPDYYWHGTSLTLVNWVVNTELIEEYGLEMPETWDDLLQEGLEGQVSMSNPASSGTAYNVVSAVLQTKGEDEGWEYLEKLIDQVPYFTARGSDPANNVVNGEAIIGINASNGDSELEENYPYIELVYPSDGTGWWPQPVAIVNGTQNEDAAKVFIDWVLSVKGMETIAESRYAAVARTDVEIPEGIVDIQEIELFPTDFQANALQRDAILEEWNSRVEE